MLKGKRVSQVEVSYWPEPATEEGYAYCKRSRTLFCMASWLFASAHLLACSVVHLCAFVHMYHELLKRRRTPDTGTGTE